MGKLITASQAAEILNVSVQRVYELIRLGLIPAGTAVHVGRQVRIDEDGLRDWIAAGGRSLPGGWRRGA